MNYHRIYDAIIERARTREKPKCHLEIHHVLPRCIGGTDTGDNLVALTIREHYVAHRVFDRANGVTTSFGRGGSSSRKWLKSRMMAYTNASKPIQDARKFLESHGEKILAADVVTKFLKWNELQEEVLRFRATGEVDLDMAKRFEAYFRLMAMEHHCGIAGFGERNNGNHLNIFQMFGNYA